MNDQDRGGPGTAAAARRKDMASLLHKSEKMVLALLESASQGILSVDPHGRIILANARTEDMFGYSRDELLGATVEQLLPLPLRGVHDKNRQDFFSRPRIRAMGVGMDLSGRRKDGTEFPVEVSLGHVQTEEGVFAIAFVTDITQCKNLETQLMHAQKMEALGRLAGGVAHDFNNMLTIIAGYNQMILDQVSPMDPLRRFAEEILKAADRAGALTNQLLAFSRRQLTQPRVIEFNSLITNTERMLCRLIGEDIELVLNLSPAVGNIKADPSHIEQAIFNLVVNARDAMPNGGRITVQTARVYLDESYANAHLCMRPGQYVMLAISDTGHGMDAETKSRIFEPFFTTKEQGKGTGLGLATVYGSVKQSGGDIWVYSEPAKGTTFKLYFPMIADVAHDPVESNLLVPQSRGTETILVVEDEKAVRDIIATMLRQRGYDVLVAGDAHEALQISREHNGPIGLMLTDVVMPRKSGRELADELVRERPNIKVVYLSGYTEDTVFHHGALETGVDFLGKPFSQEALTQKIREVLNKDHI